MKKKIVLRRWVKVAICICIVVSASFFFYMKNKEDTEIRATWISYIDYTDILWGKSESEYRLNIEELINDLKSLKINTIYAHASAFTDAYYPSEYYPTSKYITGTIGDDLSFDPFKILVDEAKKEGFRVEAWINPLRSFSTTMMEEAPEDCIQKKWVNEKSRNLVLYEDRYYLNPAYQEVQDLIINIAVELVNNYDIDGVHMDDYFYPDHVNDSFDEIEYNSIDDGRSLSQFRKDNVNTLVSSLSKEIKNADSKCDFTISPAGNIEYTTETIYGDVETWIEEEIIDMVIPQIYFGYDHEVLPFNECLKQWENLVKDTDVKLVVGLGAYKINTLDNFAKSGKSEWVYEDDILARQIIESRQAVNYSGFSLFSYHSIKNPDENSIDLVSKQIENVIELLR